MFKQKTDEQIHIEAIINFNKSRQLPKPCMDYKCGFCSAWYGSFPNDRHDGYMKRLAAQSEAA